jgi:hypothetical protein
MDIYTCVYSRVPLNGRAGCTVLLPNEVAKHHLLDDASMFTEELYAILRIQGSTLHDFVIHSDSLSSLETIELLYLTQHPLLNQIHHVIHNLAVDKKSHSSGCQDIVVFKAMRADKAATNLQMPSDLKMNTCDLKSKIKKERLATWQNQWEQTTSQMLNIKRTTKRWKAFKVFNRRA